MIRSDDSRRLIRPGGRVVPSASPEERAAFVRKRHVEALRRERAAYVKRGNAAGVKAVDAALAALGVEGEE
jgi:hypothetical protein